MVAIVWLVTQDLKTEEENSQKNHIPESSSSKGVIDTKLEFQVILCGM